MTPETAAAMERVRRVNAGDDVADVYAEMLKCHGYEGLDTVAYSMCDSDRALLSRLFIAAALSNPLKRHVEDGWKFSFSESTRFIEGRHSRGGRMSVCEVVGPLYSTDETIETVGHAIAKWLNMPLSALAAPDGGGE